MRHTLLVILALPAAAALAAQAPPGADLWRIAALSMPVPAALADGPAGGFWNPGSGPRTRGVSVGVHVVNTSDVLGLSGLLVAASREVRGGLRLGIVAGRMQMRDLVRTTTSPNSEGGSIPVYTQAAGLTVALARPGIRLGTEVRLHDDRFDVLRENGVTVDAGVLVEPVRRLRLAAATHFLPWSLSVEPTTDLYAGAEVLAADAVPVGGIATQLTARYGVTYRPDGGRVEHAIGGGIGFADQLRVDVASIREVGPTGTAWRPVLGVSLRVGRYVLTAARGAGLQDIGGTYRIGLDIDVTP